MTSARDDLVWQVRVGGEVIRRAGRATGFNVLGTVLTADSRIDRELENRARRAWAAFFTFQFILCCKHAPLKSRLKLLAILIEPTLFWCAGSWNLTKKHQENLRGVQRAMIMKMINPKRRPEEPDDEYFKRLATKIHDVMDMAEILSWDAKWRRLYFNWAGVVARLPIFDPQRLTTRVLCYRDLKSIHEFAAKNNGHQGHNGSVHAWRWEQRIFNFAKRFKMRGWKDLAASKRSWMELQDTFLDLWAKL